MQFISSNENASLSEVGGAICAAHRDEPLTASKSAAVATDHSHYIVFLALTQADPEWEGEPSLQRNNPRFSDRFPRRELIAAVLVHMNRHRRDRVSRSVRPLG